MSGTEDKKNKTVQDAEASVNAPTEIGKPKEGTDKDIRWLSLIHI